MEHIIQEFVDVHQILIEELIDHILHIVELNIDNKQFHDILIDYRGEFVYNQILNFDNKYLNKIIMIEYKVDIVVLQMAHI